MSGSDGFKVGGGTGFQPPQFRDRVDSMATETGTGWMTLNGNAHRLQPNTKAVPFSPDITLFNMPNNTLEDGSSDDMSSVGTSSTDISFDDVQNPPDKDALQLFKDRKLSMVRGTGAFVGAGVGVIGAATAIKFAAIGAAIGTAIFPGIGTGAGALVGLAVGILAGGAAGALVGGAIGHLVGKNQAAKIDVESLVKEYGTQSPKFEKIVNDAGYELGNTRFPVDDKRIDDAFRKAMQNRIDAGRPFGKNFISTTLLALRTINSRIDLENDDKSNIGNAFLRQLNIPGRATPAMTEATVDALIGIYTARNLDPKEKLQVANRLVDQLERHNQIGQPVSPNETQNLAEQYVNEALSGKNDQI